jgi:hypothetical protein
VAPQSVTFSPHAIVRPVEVGGHTPHAYAGSQVPAMLRAFAPPPGAWRVKVSPSRGLDDVEGGMTAIDKNVVDQFADWVTPGTPAQVLALAARGLPARYQFIGSGTEGRGQNSAPVLDDVFQLLPVPRVLSLRELDISVVAVGNDVRGRPLTGIRVDAMAGWVTAGPSYQWIPAGARVMTLTETPPPPGTKPPGGETIPPPHPPVTISGAPAVRDIVSLINGMSPPPADSASSCPPDYGGRYILTFRTRAGGSVIGAVSLPMSGCAFVGILHNGKDSADLLPGDGTGAVLGRIAQISSVNWPVGGP